MLNGLKTHLDSAVLVRKFSLFWTIGWKWGSETVTFEAIKPLPRDFFGQNTLLYVKRDALKPKRAILNFDFCHPSGALCMDTFYVLNVNKNGTFLSTWFLNAPYLEVLRVWRCNKKAWCFFILHPSFCSLNVQCWC